VSKDARCARSARRRATPVLDTACARRWELGIGSLGDPLTLQRELNVTILLVHHMRKSPAAHPAQQLRGSGDFSAWLDSGLYLTRHGDDRVLVVEHRSAPAPSPFRLRLVPGDTPHLAIQDAEGGDAATAAVDPLQARVVERLHAAPRPQPTEALRVALRVRKSDLLAALRGLADRGLVTKTEHGWTLAAPTG
jgi:hypothetical protein